MKKTSLSLILCLWAVSAFAQTSVMDFYNAKVKEMSKPMYPNQTKPTFTLNITKKDVANGFVAYDYTPALGYLAGVTNSPEQMAYFTSKDGQKFVAVVSIVCKGNYCSAEMPKFFTLENGALINKTEQYLPTHVVKQIEKAILEKMSTVIRKVGKEDVNFVTWVKLPQIGTTIQIGVQESNSKQAESYLACELTYNEENGTFTFVKK